MVDRRAFLRGVGAMGLLGTAGCAGTGVDTSTMESPTPTQSPTATESMTTDPTATDRSESPNRTADVAAGPEGRLRFDPDEVEIAVDDAVRWTFESAGHNVTSKPGASNRVRNPPEAEPFATYEGDDHFSLVEPDETFTHTFTVPGEYVYVCTPHVSEGMVGSVIVAEA